MYIWNTWKDVCRYLTRSAWGSLWQCAKGFVAAYSAKTNEFVTRL